MKEGCAYERSLLSLSFFRLWFERDAVDVRRPGVGAAQAYGVAAGLQSDGQADGTDAFGAVLRQLLDGSVGVSIYFYLDEAVVHFAFPRFGRQVGDGQCVAASFVAMDVAPFHVVVFASADVSYNHSSRSPFKGLGADDAFLFTQVVVKKKVSPFGFIAGRFEALFCLEAQNFYTVRR